VPYNNTVAEVPCLFSGQGQDSRQVLTGTTALIRGTPPTSASCGPGL